MSALFSFAVVLIAYAVIAEFALARGTGSEHDYLLGGRASNRVLVGLSAGAASASGFIMTGAVGSGYTLGLTAVFIPLAWFFGDLVFWSLFPARIHRLATRTGCETVPALLGATTPDRSRFPVRSVAAVCIVIFVGQYASAQLLAAGKTLNALFEIPRSAGILVSAIIIVAYCARGGLRASIWTNAMQAVVMVLTSVGVLAAIVMDCGGPANAIAGLAAGHPQLLDPFLVNRNWLLMALFVAGFAGAAVGFDLSTPQLLVRVMSGRDSQEAAAAKWYYLLFMQITWITMALFGMFARLALPDIADPEQALPAYALAMLPPWVVGLIIAGMFSAIASTLEGQFLVLSSSLAVDVAPSVHARLTGKFGARLDAVVTGFVGAALAIFTLGISSTIFDLIIFSANMLSAAFAPVMLLVLYGARRTPASLKAAMCTGIVVAMSWRLLGWHTVMLEAVPGMLAGFLANYCVTRVLARAAQPGCN